MRIGGPPVWFVARFIGVGPLFGGIARFLVDGGGRFFGWRGLCWGVWFWVSGRGQCRVGAFSVSGLQESDFLFTTISHCAWRHVISLSKATKKRSKENALTALP